MVNFNVEMVKFLLVSVMMVKGTCFSLIVSNIVVADGHKTFTEEVKDVSTAISTSLTFAYQFALAPPLA